MPPDPPPGTFVSSESSSPPALQAVIMASATSQRLAITNRLSITTRSESAGGSPKAFERLLACLIGELQEPVAIAGGPDDRSAICRQHDVTFAHVKGAPSKRGFPETA